MSESTRVKDYYEEVRVLHVKHLKQIEVSHEKAYALYDAEVKRLRSIISVYERRLELDV